MAYGTYEYDPDDSALSFEIEWTDPGPSERQDDKHERHLKATAEKAAKYIEPVLDIGEYWTLDHVELRLGSWETPMLRAWFRGPPGYLTEESDDPDAAEKVRQRKEFYEEHNTVHDERIGVDGHFSDLKIDVRQF